MQLLFKDVRTKIVPVIHSVTVFKISLPTEKKRNMVVYWSIIYVSASLIVFAVFTRKHSVWTITHLHEDQ